MNTFTSTHYKKGNNYSLKKFGHLLMFFNILGGNVLLSSNRKQEKDQQSTSFSFNKAA